MEAFFLVCVMGPQLQLIQSLLEGKHTTDKLSCMEAAKA